jgi:cytochrome P450
MEAETMDQTQTSAAPAAPGQRIEIDLSVYNPGLPEFIREPMPTWQKLVQDYPIAYHRDLHMWFVNTHDLCADIIKNPKFTPNWNQWEMMPPPDPNAEVTDFDRMMQRSLAVLDPACDLRLRKLTMPEFSR